MFSSILVEKKTKDMQLIHKMLNAQKMFSDVD